MRTPTSSQNPVLGNKPIAQWKVTELKEELKRRRLKTGGLKDELIRRLDEALRAEMEVTNVEDDNVYNDNGVGETATGNIVTDAHDNLTETPIVVAADFGAVVSETAAGIMGKAVETLDGIKETVGCADVNDPVVGEESITVTDVASVVEELKPGLADPVILGEALVTAPDVASVGDEVSIEQQSSLHDDPVLGDEIVMTTDVVSVGDEVSKEQQSGLGDDLVAGEGIGTTDVASVVCDDVSMGLSSEKSVAGDGLIDDKTKGDNQVLVEQEHSVDVTPAHEDVKRDSSDQTKQVSEVSASLGFPSNNSISTDSLSVVEKNDVKDNLIADNVKLESHVKLEMVLPSSSDVVSDVGELHPRDVDEPCETKISVEETDNTVANADMSQNNYSADFSSEKLNLDRSSGDDSMEEDALESKQIDSNLNTKDVGENSSKIEATAMDTDSPLEKKITDDQKSDVATLSDKRKLSDEDTIATKPAKRQHRWKKESDIVTEPQNSHIPPLASTQDVPQSDSLRRSFSRSNSTVSNDPPKEREVPPSTKPATNSLRIDHFLRPFTLKAVKELLGNTGTFTSFWMDHIKTHCYVTYSSIEESVETRNAVYNLQWPPNGGRQLVAEFVDPEEVKLRLEPPPTAPTPPLNAVPTKVPEVSTGPQPSLRQQRLRQQPTLSPPPPIPSQAPVRERLNPPPPPRIENVDPSILTLDDLFRKTKATPRIYYLPLSDEQVASRPKISKQ